MRSFARGVAAWLTTASIPSPQCRYRREIAKAKYAPFNRPRRHRRARTGRSPMAPACGIATGNAGEAWAAYAESGMLSDRAGLRDRRHAVAGTVEAAAHSIFSKASVSISWAMLTTGNANLLMVHGTPLQKEVSPRTNLPGAGWARCACLSRRRGSSLSDIAARAELEDENVTRSGRVTGRPATRCDFGRRA